MEWKSSAEKQTRNESSSSKQPIPCHINILLLKLILEGARTKHDMFEVGSALKRGAGGGDFHRALST